MLHVLLGAIGRTVGCQIYRINANAPVADRSAYTAIIAGRLWLEEGPTLVLNADYAATSVPVPDGIGQRDKGVRLVE